MKKSFLLLIIIFAGCSLQKVTHIPEDMDIAITNFKPFTEKGFLFTPYSYQGEYESIASLIFTYTPEFELVTVERPATASTWEQGSTRVSSWERRSGSTRVIELVYEYCLEIGADAFVDFRFSREHAPGGNLYEEVISGFAIRRIKSTNP